jgi:hypothetical protein
MLNLGIIPAHNLVIKTESGERLEGEFYDNYE